MPWLQTEVLGELGKVVGLEGQLGLQVPMRHTVIMRTCCHGMAPGRKLVTVQDPTSTHPLGNMQPSGHSSFSHLLSAHAGVHIDRPWG